MKQFENLVGKQYGLLTVESLSDPAQNGSRRWLCRCECGNVTYRAKDTLTNPNLSMCAECAAKYSAKIARSCADFVEGTQLSMIRNMNPGAANTSGYRGIYYESKYDRFRARIIFKKKQYYLGTYKNIEDAIKTRQRAEVELFGTFLETYEKVDER